MRLPPLPPDTLPPEQRSLYDDMAAGIGAHFKRFASARSDGALIGPFNPMLHFPEFGRAAWDYTKALTLHSTLPKPAHEVAILVTGARFGSRYELYAHERIAGMAGLSDGKIATIVAGQRPADLSAEEGVAYDVAAALSCGGPLPEATFQAARRAFGDKGAAELVFLVGGYCLVSVMLNAYDVSVPGSEEGIG